MKSKILDEMENVCWKTLLIHIEDCMHMHELQPENNIKELMIEVMSQVIDDAIESNIS